MEAPCAGRSGSVVALDPETGEILAMTSTARPTTRTSSPPASSPALWSAAHERPRDAAHEPRDPGPVRARAARSRSSMALAALEEGVITPADHASTARATSRSTTRSSAATRPRATGSSTCSRRSRSSCNVYFYNVGIRLEIDAPLALREAAGPRRAHRHRPAARGARPHARARSGSCARRRCRGTRARRSRSSIGQGQVTVDAAADGAPGGGRGQRRPAACGRTS